MRIRGLFVAPLLVSLLGCQSMTYAPQGEGALPMASAGTPATRTIHETGMSHYLFWGILPISTCDVNEKVRGDLAAGDRVVSLQIKESNTFLMGLLACLTYGIYRPRHIDVSAGVSGGGL